MTDNNLTSDEILDIFGGFIPLPAASWLMQDFVKSLSKADVKMSLMIMNNLYLSGKDAAFREAAQVALNVMPARPGSLRELIATTIFDLAGK